MFSSLLFSAERLNINIWPNQNEVEMVSFLREVFTSLGGRPNWNSNCIWKHGESERSILFFTWQCVVIARLARIFDHIYKVKKQFSCCLSKFDVYNEVCYFVVNASVIKFVVVNQFDRKFTQRWNVTWILLRSAKLFSIVNTFVGQFWGLYNYVLLVLHF